MPQFHQKWLTNESRSHNQSQLVLCVTVVLFENASLVSERATTRLDQLNYGERNSEVVLCWDLSHGRQRPTTFHIGRKTPSFQLLFEEVHTQFTLLDPKVWGGRRPILAPTVNKLDEKYCSRKQNPEGRVLTFTAFTLALEIDGPIK